ncbi:MAG: hypothetical protein LBS08_04700 [Candidatus Symbiothrix sp.]|jgi:hypothetical protein|nr:hypothetical protein [Candidatus Symbiothrix sp.]
MSHIFRLNTELQNGQGTLPPTIQDWGNTNAMGYTPTEIAQIPPSNPNSTNEPTSIPSPFARLALTKTAFKEVAEKGANALMAYRQIVSNSLDVAEIFFNFSTLKNHAGLEIIKWAYNPDLQNIRSSILKSTLELFFDGDAQSLNLSNTTTFYFIRHRDTGKIIGGTSPRTLFFSASNVKRRRGGIVEPEFIKTDGTLFVKNEITNDEAQYGKMELSNNHYAFSEIKPLSERDIKFQDYLHTWVKTNNIVVLELSAYLRSQIVAAQTAHFNALPAILNAYTRIQWLTDDDFLEKHLITLPELDCKNFVTGSYDNNNKKNGTCLLPLTEEFFKYFKVEDLQRKDFFEIRKSGDVYEVILRIQVKKGTVEFSKKYKTFATDESKGEGYVKSGKLENFALFPNVKFNEDKDVFYRFILFKQNLLQAEAKFFNGSEPAAIEEVRTVNRGEDADFSKYETYLLEKHNFDRIQIGCDDNSLKGFIVPLLPEKQANMEFTFAVDFGTTNTHIEYCYGSNDSRKLDIAETDKQIVFAQADELKSIVTDIDFIPETTDERNCDFPIRTALSVKKVVEKWQSHFNDKVLSLPQAGKLNSFYQKINGRFTANSSDIGDIASFFFSIIDNDIKDVNVNDANYHTLLQSDRNLKIVFYLFYSAIVYHTAQLMKTKGFDAPGNITFSGNGSKVVNILTENKKLEALAKTIFKKVYAAEVSLELKYESSKPKEITCQGGIRAVDWNVDTTITIPIGVLLNNKPVEIMIGNTTAREINSM